MMKNLENMRAELRMLNLRLGRYCSVIFHNTRNRSPTGRRRLLEVQDSAGSNPAGSTNAPVMQSADIGYSKYLFLRVRVPPGAPSGL